MPQFVLMPVPIFPRLAVLVELCLKAVDKILQSVGGLPKDLMKEGPEEAKRGPLEFVTTAMEEERENQGAVSSFMTVESVFQQCRLPRARLSLDPEQASTASGPAPIRLVFEQPPACPLDSAANLMRPIVHLWKG